MKKLEVLKSNDLMTINGGGARPGPSTIGINAFHNFVDIFQGFVDRWNLYRK